MFAILITSYFQLSHFLSPFFKEATSLSDTEFIEEELEEQLKELIECEVGIFPDNVFDRNDENEDNKNECQ